MLRDLSLKPVILSVTSLIVHRSAQEGLELLHQFVNDTYRMSKDLDMAQYQTQRRYFDHLVAQEYMQLGMQDLAVAVEEVIKQGIAQGLSHRCLEIIQVRTSLTLDLA